MNITEISGSMRSMDQNIPVIAGRIYDFLTYPLLAIFAVAVCFIAWLLINFKLSLIQGKRQKDFENEALQIARRTEILNEMLNKNIEELSTSYLQKFIDDVKESISKYDFKKELGKKLLKAGYLLEKRTHEEELRDILLERNFHEKIIHELKEEQSRLWKKNETLRNDKEDIIAFLKTDENNVFIARELSKKQVEALLAEGYKHSNQFSVNENKIISVLVKSPLNHSPVHTFLVWSIGKLLERIKGIKEIEYHDTRDADITFEYDNKNYAIEIETGNLLRKKEQLKEKLNYLNRKYPERWMFVVSHRKLLAKYRKYGLSTPRNKVSENIKKMLKTST